MLAWILFCRMSLLTTFLTSFFSRPKKLDRCSKENDLYYFAALKMKLFMAAVLNALSRVACRNPFSNSGILVIALML